MHLQAQHTGQ